jgi:signal transduction histidine kinase
LARLAVSLNELLGRLQEAFRREGRFLDQASHELRTPLAVLKMELELAAARDGDPEQLREALVNASREADRLVRLAEDLLVLARIRGGRLPVRRVPTSLSELVDGVCTAHRATARAVGSRLVGRAPPVVVPVDPSRVRQALEDLLDNALRYGAGKPIEVSGDRDGDLVRISVRDHWPGFDPEVLPTAAEAFVRGSPPQPEMSDGGGLGLAIVRAVAEAHGGRLELENVPGGGAIVAFTLRSGDLASLPEDPHVQ